ncbi:hypothetical protein A1359_19065 [Methylomonas lenta]|uniref:Uncharacterized protein n=1 Tax=Methylomonas lenta TaxID=980561 RepID=A0A177NXG8_9GAMM|nr:hypothetical protein [Methylomonas lenta]OAI21760.1 hypothetical protein A1359_19065 [Methylomonas lenta]
MQIDIHAIQIEEVIPIDLLTNIASALLVSVWLPNQAQAEKCRELTHKQAETNNSMQQVSRASKIMGADVRNPNGDALCGIPELDQSHFLDISDFQREGII